MSVGGPRQDSPRSSGLRPSGSHRLGSQSLSSLPPRFGRYEVSELLGEGGAGRVYLGFDRARQQWVAIKTLKGRSNPKKLEALLSEAAIAQAIKGEACVPCLEVLPATATTPVALVSEFIDGCNLREFLEEWLWPYTQEQRMPPLLALLIFEQLLWGVREAHEAGLIHQDLKPENYLVRREVLDLINRLSDADGLPLEVFIDQLEDRRDQPWILLADWGLTLCQDQPDDSSASLSVSLSQIPENKRGGTLIYMAPEQFDGIGISRRSDVFALSLIFYELLTGCSPKAARSVSEGLDEACFEDAQALLVRITTSTSPSAIRPSKDSNLGHLRRFPQLLETLGRMAWRKKAERLNSETIEERLPRLFAEIETGGVEPPSLLKRAALMAALLLLAVLSVLVIPNPPAKQPLGLPKSKPVSSQEQWLERLNKGDWDACKDIESLNERLAEKLLMKPGAVLSLPSLKALEVKQARTLARFHGQLLVLDGLTELTQSAAYELSYFKGPGLSLSGLEELPVDVAKALVTTHPESVQGPFEWADDSRETLFQLAELNRREHLFNFCNLLGSVYFLKGLKALDNDLALILSKTDRSLMVGVKQGLRIDAAKTLAANPRTFLDLWLNSELSEGTAKRLAAARARSLTLHDMVAVTPSIMKRLKEFRGQVLQLPAIESLDGSTAEHLAQCRCQALVLGVESLDPEAAKRFAGYSGGTVIFDRLTRLSRGVADKLSQLRCRHLWFLGLESLERGAAQEISAFRGASLNIYGLGTLSQENARSFANTRAGILRFANLKTLGSAAEALAKFRGRALALGGLKCLTVVEASALARSKLDLEFPQLEELTPAVARAFRSYSGPRLRFLNVQKISVETATELVRSKAEGIVLGMRDSRAESLKVLAGRPRVGLLFNGISQLKVAQAHAVKDFEGRFLVFDAVRELGPAAAQELAASRAKCLQLEGLIRLDFEVAQILSGFRGEVLFIGVSELDFQVARALARFKGDSLSLNCLLRLTPEAARGLAQGPVRELRFGVLTRLDLDSAEALAKFAGHSLTFDKLRGLSPELATVLARSPVKVLDLQALKGASDDVLKALKKHKGQVLLKPNLMLRMSMLR